MAKPYILIIVSQNTKRNCPILPEKGVSVSDKSYSQQKKKFKKEKSNFHYFKQIPWKDYSIFRKTSAYQIQCCSLELILHHLHHHYHSLMAEKLFLSLCLLDEHLALAQQSFARPQGDDVLLQTGVQCLLSLPAENKMHTIQTEKNLYF